MEKYIRINFLAQHGKVVVRASLGLGLTNTPTLAQTFRVSPTHTALRLASIMTLKLTHSRTHARIHSHSEQ